MQEYNTITVVVVVVVIVGGGGGVIVVKYILFETYSFPTLTSTQTYNLITYNNFSLSYLCWVAGFEIPLDFQNPGHGYGLEYLQAESLSLLSYELREVSYILSDNSTKI